MIDDPLNRTKVRRGSDLPQAKLSEDDVRIIRQLIEQRDTYYAMARSLSNRKIAEKFDVHLRTIDRLSAGETWGHVE